MSERKPGIFSKIKSKIPDFERGKAKIITTPLKYSGTGIHTVSISRIYPPQAGYNLSLTQRLGKITVFGRALNSPRPSTHILNLWSRRRRARWTALKAHRKNIDCLNK